MKDLDLALYMNFGDFDASEIGENSSHKSRGMGVLFLFNLFVNYKINYYTPAISHFSAINVKCIFWP